MSAKAAAASMGAGVDDRVAAASVAAAVAATAAAAAMVASAEAALAAAGASAARHVATGSRYSGEAAAVEQSRPPYMILEGVMCLTMYATGWNNLSGRRGTSWARMHLRDLPSLHPHF